MHALPIHQNLVYTDLPHTSFEQFLRAIWNAVFQAIALILSSKLNSQLIHLQCRGSGFNPWVQFLEKEMATHSSVLAWRIPWTEEPGRLQSMRFQKSDMTEQLNHHLNCAFFFFFGWQWGPWTNNSIIAWKLVKNVLFLILKMPTPDLLNQNLWARAPGSCVLTSPPVILKNNQVWFEVMNIF